MDHCYPEEKVENLFYLLFAAPVALWAFGGFKLHEFAQELPKIIIWYVVIGGAYILLGV